MKYCRLIISLILFAVASLVIAQDRTLTKNNEADIYDNLYEIYQQSKLHRGDSTCIQICDSMRALAIKQGDKRAIAMSYANPISYYYGKKMYKEMLETIDKIKVASEEAELWSFYYYGISQKAIYLLAKEKFQEGIELGEKTMEKAYADNNKNGIFMSHNILVNCFLALRLYDKGIEEAKKAVEAEIGLPDNKFGSSVSKLVEMYYRNEDYDGCLQTIEKYESLVENETTKVRLSEHKVLCYYWLGQKEAFAKEKENLNALYVKYGVNATKEKRIKIEGFTLIEKGKYREAEDLFLSLGGYEKLRYLNYLYKVTGNVEKMSEIYKMHQDSWTQMHNSLYESDLEQYREGLENNKLELANQELVYQKRQMIGYGILILFGILLVFSSVLFWNKYVSNKKLQKANKMLEDQLQQVIQANKANDAKTAFLFSMSHDIRTPMNAIIGYTNLIEKNLGEEKKCKDYLSKIKGANEFLLSLINNVLEMARIESGKMILEEQPCRPVVLVNEISNVYEELMKGKGIKFTTHFDVDAKAIYADRTKMQEVILNIVSNAYKYTPAGGSVDIKVTQLPCNRKGYVAIKSVYTDTGIGMSKEYLPTIFEEFSREKSVTENKIQGTGLGLPIVKKLVELMGGTIEVESELGKGTTITLVIEHRIAEESALPASTEQIETEVEITDFSGKNILLAEDNELNAEIAIEILTALGLKVDRAEDGKDCVEKLTNSDAGVYDIILMDVQMPVMNGYEAARAIRQLPDPAKANIPILAMTANAFEEDKADAKQAGMNGHLSKPIDVAELKKTLTEQLC